MPVTTRHPACTLMQPSAHLIGLALCLNEVQVINRFLSKFTGMSTDEIEVETDRDNFLSPQGAIDRGVIDRVLAQ